jgi:antitoxin (DNA-binding transcriptional repressor) of toxin-antitoxin stability system
MTIQMNVAEAKAKLSELIARAEAGEEVVIARDGKPVVSLRPTPSSPAGKHRVLGAWAHYGPLTDPDLFLQPDHELEALADASVFPTK